MRLQIDEEMRGHLREILAENRSEASWAQTQACDWFQSTQYCGGFEDTEMAFTFSHYDANGVEYWFQFSLSELPGILENDQFCFDAHEANLPLKK